MCVSVCVCVFVLESLLELVLYEFAFYYCTGKDLCTAVFLLCTARARNIIVKDKITTLVDCPLTGLDLTGFDLQTSLAQAQATSASSTGSSIGLGPRTSTTTSHSGWQPEPDSENLEKSAQEPEAQVVLRVGESAESPAAAQRQVQLEVATASGTVTQAAIGSASGTGIGSEMPVIRRVPGPAPAANALQVYDCYAVVNHYGQVSVSG
jgi:hypothetical protein